MNLRELIERPHVWLAAPGGGRESVTVSSRVRLARNLAGVAFPGWAGAAERERLWKELRARLLSLPSMQGALAAGNDELAERDRLILFERHLISREHAGKGPGSGIVLCPDESISIMVNEEDHLRIQALCTGLRLQEAWRAVNPVDTELDAVVSYAFSPRWGYLTACPTNVGTGLRASVMLHLPGLVLMEDLPRLVKGVSKIGLAVRGVWGEGTEAHGHLFQISNQMTLGEREEDILRNLDQIVSEIVQHELDARARLWTTREVVLRDAVGRAAGILANAHVLSSREALDLLSALRLGIEMGILPGVERREVLELLLLTQPAHLQLSEGRPLNPFERDRARAALVRRRLAGALRPTIRGRRAKNE